jgi:hypothetical protein
MRQTPSPRSSRRCTAPYSYDQAPWALRRLIARAASRVLSIAAFEEAYVSSGVLSMPVS